MTRLKDPGQNGFYPAEGKHVHIMARATGEKRPPRCGEWYLSGGPVMAYMAREDLSSPYYIAKLYEVERIVTIREKK